MFAIELQNAIETAPRSKLQDVAEIMWRAYGAGQIDVMEAGRLSALIEARKALPATPAAPGAPAAPRRSTGSRPRTDASQERRRRWAASGRLPPGIACRFTLAEQAALAVITNEHSKRGDCRMHLDGIAALAGVSRSTVRNALRQARILGLITVHERRLNRYRNDTNVVRIISKEWLSWMRLARQGGGVKTATGTNTTLIELARKRRAERSEGLSGSGDRHRPSRPSRSGAGGLTREAEPFA